MGTTVMINNVDNDRVDDSDGGDYKDDNHDPSNNDAADHLHNYNNNIHDNNNKYDDDNHKNSSSNHDNIDDDAREDVNDSIR